MKMSSPWPHDIPDEVAMNTLLDKAKGKLFFSNKAGWLGSLVCNHTFIWDMSQPTAWCDGSTIGINPIYFFQLSKAGRVALIVHEVWHTGYDHMGRIGDRDPEVWNWAADYVINLNVKEDGFALEDLGRILYDIQYQGMSTEQVYDLIVKDGNFKPAPGTFTGDVVKSVDKDSTATMSKIIQATQSSIASKDAGTIPGEISTYCDEFLSPILPWELLLARFFTELSKDDYSWRRPSRRHEDEYLPSLIGNNGLEHLIFYFDVSGSVLDQDIVRFNSEVKYIQEELAPERLTLVTFDTKIRDIYEFAKEDTFDEIKVTGRGGTSLSPVHAHITKNRPTAAVIFSDLWCDPMAETPVPLLWVILDNKFVSPPTGQIIHLESEAA